MNVTKQQCLEFQKNPEINPITKRKIKINGPTHKMLMKACDAQSVKIPLKEAIRTPPVYRPVPPPPVYRPSPPHPVYRPVPKAAYKTPDHKTILLFIMGLGWDKVGDEELNRFSESYKTTYNIETRIMRNTNLKSTILGIAKTVCYMAPSLSDKFVLEVYDTVKKYRNLNYKVLLIGHSYGGAIVSRVAEKYEKHPDPGVHMKTLGSIYIYKPKHVNLKHYMFYGDVALKCNKLKKDAPGINWMRPMNYKTPPKKQFSLFGTQEEWTIHNEYKSILSDIVNNFKT